MSFLRPRCRDCFRIIRHRGCNGVAPSPPKTAREGLPPSPSAFLHSPRPIPLRLSSTPTADRPLTSRIGRRSMPDGPIQEAFSSNHHDPQSNNRAILTKYSQKHTGTVRMPIRSASTRYCEMFHTMARTRRGARVHRFIPKKPEYRHNRPKEEDY